MPNYPMTMQYEPDGRPYFYTSSGGKNYVSPVAMGTARGGPDSQSFLHTGSQWNQDTGAWENPINWGNLMALGVGAGIAAPFVVPAIAGAAGGAGGGAAAGATAVPGITTTGATAGLTGSIAGAGTTGAAAAGVGGGAAAGGGLASQVMNYYNRYQQVAGLAGAGVGGAMPNTANSSTSPTLDPALQPLQQAVLQQIMGRINSGDSLPPGYETGGIKSINNVYDLVNQGRNNDLTSRGLSTSPMAAAADSTFATKRAGSVGDFRANVPLVNRELQNQDLNAAMGLLNFGRGSSSTQSSGGGFGGAATNIATMLGYYYGNRRAGGTGGANG